MKKYELTEERLLFSGRTLYRIRACVDFTTITGFKVKAGDLGGFVECEENLSHDGLAWVRDRAAIREKAKVSGNAEISGKAVIYDNARVYGDAMVLGHAIVGDNAAVYDNAKIYEHAMVEDFAEVGMDAKVYKTSFFTDGNIRTVSFGCQGMCGFTLYTTVDGGINVSFRGKSYSCWKSYDIYKLEGDDEFLRLVDTLSAKQQNKILIAAIKLADMQIDDMREDVKSKIVMKKEPEVPSTKGERFIQKLKAGLECVCDYIYQLFFSEYARIIWTIVIIAALFYAAFIFLF